jgi:hypothetical protein
MTVIIPSSRLLQPARPLDVLLLATNSGMAFAAARCLDLAGLRFHVLAPGRYWSTQTMRTCVGASLIDITQLDGVDSPVLSVIRRVIDAHPEIVIVPAGMQATYTVARYSEVLPWHNVFPLSPEPLLRQLHDKWAFAELLAALGVPHPRTRLVRAAADVEGVPVEAPLVVKPLDAEASQGVRVVRSRDELRSMISEIDGAGLLPVLCQEFIPGDDLALMLVVDHGVIVGSRLHHYLPDGDLRLLDRADAIDLVRGVVAALQFHGVVDFDLRRDDRDDALWVTECNPRLYATSHKSAYAGMNPVEIGVRMAQGGPALHVEPPMATLIEEPLRALKTMAQGRRAVLSTPTRRALRAEASNPVSSLVRALEWRRPELARAVRGERATNWEAFSQKSRIDAGGHAS